MEEPDDDLHISLLFFGLYASISSVTVIIQVFLSFFEDLSLEDYLNGFFHVAIVLSVCAVNWLCLYCLKKGVDRLLGAYQIEKLNKFKIECVICYGGMAVGGIVPRILVLFEPPGLYMKDYGLIIYPWFSLNLVYFFLKDLGIRFKVSIENHIKLIHFSYLLHLFSLLYTLRLNYYIHLDRQTQEDVNIVQLVFCFSVAISTVDLITVLTGGVRDSMAPNVPIQKTIGKTAPMAQLVENDPRIECKICLLEYNQNTRTPRILKECGHTVCQECAQNFLRKFNNMHLFCPFCQQMSVIKGPATVLAKNFFVTDFMWKLKNDKN